MRIQYYFHFDEFKTASYIFAHKMQYSSNISWYGSIQVMRDYNHHTKMKWCLYVYVCVFNQCMWVWRTLTYKRLNCLGRYFTQIWSINISDWKIGVFLFRYFNPFQDGVPYNNVTTQCAERFYLFNPLYCIRKTVHLIDIFVQQVR